MWRFGRMSWAALLGAMLVSLTACKDADPNRVKIASANGVHVFTVELADDDAERRQGLMFRREMAEDAGMLFDFKEERPVGIWMKNTYIPLDIIFIDRNGVIVKIHPRAEPHSETSMRSDTPVVAVLEINGGVAEKLGVKPGDTVAHPMFDAWRETAE